MYPNGTGAAERNTEKESAVQRLDRYIHDFRSVAMKTIQTRMTGHLCLTVNMRDGSIFQRSIIAEDVGK